jgi:glyoxylase-like metal-dependent hydrolase (beta-lactamase superfamily II)
MLAEVEIRPGVFQFQLPMPFELRHVNVYLLRDGDGYTLIDTGLRTEESRAALDASLDAAGIRLPQIRRILITHIHPDHFGLAGELRQRSGARLVIHRLEVALMEPRYARAEDLVREVGRWLEVNGVPAEAREFLQSASMAAREFVSVVSPDLLLEGAERFAVNGEDLVAIWTPGHSPGHCVFYWPGRRLLFSGDHLLLKISPNIGLHPQSSADPLDDYLASLQRVAALPIDEVLPAHGPTFGAHRERIGEIVRHHQERLEAVVRLAAQPQTGWELAAGLFPGITERNVFHQRLALQETLAHCQSLGQAGRLDKRIDADDRVRWVAA